MGLSDSDRNVAVALAEGLPLEPWPYARLAERLGLTENQIIAAAARLIEGGVVQRFGVIVRHRELGYRANAMVVWNVADDAVDAAGERLAALPYVTLCYQRPRRRPDWPYNLFSMIHGRERAAVEALVAEAARDGGIEDVPRAVLFSRRQFKQRGARYDAGAA